MRFALAILAYAIIGSCVFTWTSINGVISPFIAVGLFIIYGILGGILFGKLGDKGFLI